MHGLGSVLAVVVPPLIAGAIFLRRTWLRLLCLVAGLFFLFCLALSDSGTGWLATIFGLAFVFLAWRLWTIAIMIPAAALITAFIFDVYSKFVWLSQSLSTITLLDRVHIWANTLLLFTGKYIFTGLGLGSWYDKYRVQYGISVQHIHNNYLQIYADCGILGVLAMVVAYVILVRLTIRIVTASKNNPWYGPAVGLVGGIVAGAFFAFLDVTTNGIVILNNNFMYLSIPVLWIWTALLVTAQKKLSAPPEHG
jgi:O-antigen ligase